MSNHKKIMKGEVEEYISYKQVRQLLDIQKDTILAFFRETISRLDKATADIHDLKTSQTFKGDNFCDKTAKIEVEVKILKEDSKNTIKLQAKLDADTKQLKQKNIELEDRNRRNNLRIDWITENERRKHGMKVKRK